MADQSYPTYREGLITRFNRAASESIVGKYFQLSQRHSTFTTEIRAGLVTFLTSAYILAVNANVLADSGGPCTWKDCTGSNITPSCVFDPKNVGYTACKDAAKKSMITATAAASMVAAFLMGVAANMPLAVAPAMGLNAYFAYTVVGYHGSGSVTYKEALAAVVVEGLIFIALGVTGMRSHVIRLIPRNIMLATSAGIGLFLAHIGLQSAQGLGVIAFNPATLVTLGGCPENHRVYMYPIANATAVCSVDPTTLLPKTNLPTASSNFLCMTKQMRSATMWLGIAGGLLMVLLLSLRVRGAVMYGILFVTFISWIPTRGNKATFLGKHAGSGGEGRLEYFKKVVTRPDATKTTFQLDFGAFDKVELWVALITMLYVNFLDTTGTLYSMSSFINMHVPGFINENREFPRQIMAYIVDGLSIILGGLLGISPLTTYIESATGIKEGGRTGITGITIALCFFISLFFTPILASIPPYATGPALILVGALMMENIKSIEWHNPVKAVPAFLTIAIMPLTYSVAYGIIAGLCTAIFLEGSHSIIRWFSRTLLGGSTSGSEVTDETLSQSATTGKDLHSIELPPPHAHQQQQPGMQH